MTKIYNSFRLLGYKINELPSGYFIGQRPGGSKSLFDANGNILIENKEYISQIYDTVFDVIQDSKSDMLTLYDTHGNIRVNEKYREIETHDTYITVDMRPNDRLGIYDVYSIDFNAKFTNIEGKAFQLVRSNDEYKLIYANRENSVTVVDTHNQETKLPMDITRLYEANWYYLLGDMEESPNQFIMDYNGNILYESAECFIDNSILHSKRVITIGSEELTVIDENGKVIRTIANTEDKRSTEFISSASFTSEPDVICIYNNIKRTRYLLNIKTNKKSDTYQFMNSDPFIVLDKKKEKLCLLDKTTFEPIKEISGLLFDTKDCMLVVDKKDAQGGIIQEYYTLDFRPLIHEF